ncbi:MAG: Transcriptional regulator, GntR family domain / Aspartate aminotransferase [uncultured Corynebacteriales bacterium]|uniref:Transcriptional regulator, GntR family domain / Aspartate aminotransferase n=1 Tax=uncultured Mycobacteriales bacterium TaxID=581187 RepID=A0A6J4HKC1_9ACTN|nr:MAG: Transcriptional regulator, GntR family domain / Aspartate aminotransferase [uncultured Corynebacteriales bacterium]
MPIALLFSVMSDDSSSRIVADLRDWIRTAPAEARLPSTRELVARHQAGPLTVQRALRTLAAQGLIESRPGVGTFVRAVRTARPADYGWQTAALRSPPAPIRPVPTALRSTPNDVIALHSGYPDRELLPERLVRAALARAARTDAAMARSPAAGLPELQAWFVGELAAATPAGVSPPTPSDAIVLPGSQSGLSAVFRALVAPGRPLLLESPTYWGAILAAQQAGVRIVPVPSGPAGPDAAELARAFDETGARVFYAQPDHANPTGAQWPAALRETVLDLVRRHGAFLVEDDWAHDLGITATPVPVATQDDSGHVVYLRSLTKGVSPALRVAAVVARGPARDRILADRAAESVYVSGLLQAAALDVVTQPGWGRHLAALRERLRDRRDLLLAALAEHAPTATVELVPAGGLNLWLRLPDGTDVHRLARDCEDSGLVLAPGTEWFPAEPAGPYIRLNYAGPNPAAHPAGARILGAALARH